MWTVVAERDEADVIIVEAVAICDHHQDIPLLHLFGDFPFCDGFFLQGRHPMCAEAHFGHSDGFESCRVGECRKAVAEAGHLVERLCAAYDTGVHVGQLLDIAAEDIVVYPVGAVIHYRGESFVVTAAAGVFALQASHIAPSGTGGGARGLRESHDGVDECHGGEFRKVEA